MIGDDIKEGLISTLESLADQYAQAQAHADHLAEFRKSKKALLMIEAEKAGHKTTAAQEREAYAHADYIALLDGLKVATEQALSLRHRIKACEMRFEAWRTKQATRRAEMNLR